MSRSFCNLCVRIGLLAAFCLPPAIGVPKAFSQTPPSNLGGGSSSTPASSVAAPTEPRPANAPKLPREVIILQGAADAEEFWKNLASPDWILSRPSVKRTLVDAPPQERPAESIIEAVHVEGVVSGDFARIKLDLDCTLLKPGPVWAPLRVDAPVILEGRNGDRKLVMRRLAGDENRWEALLEGERVHRLQIEASVPVRVDSERRFLELAIPEAPATSFDLLLPDRAYDVDAGSSEPLRTTPVERGVRVAAHVAPRSTLVVGWSEQSEAGPRAAPLLSAQVEIAMEVDAESVLLRSSWAIACSRGVARSLRIRLEDDEDVTRFQLNDQFAPSGIERSDEANFLTIPLAEPLRSGESRRLVLETRRPISQGEVLRFSGYPLVDAGEQSGYLGVIHGPNLFLDVVNSHGLRRIDPRDLPTALKARPGTTVAMQFVDQPFSLGLRVEETPPLFRADTSARIHFDADVVRNETSIDVERVRGSLFELEVLVPSELEIVSVGPPELVQAVSPSQPTSEDEERSQGVVKIRLTPQARDRRGTFRLTLSGRQPAPSPGVARLGLFSPRGAISTASSFALFAGRDVTLEPLDASLERPPLDPPTASGSGTAEPPSLILRSGRNPSTLDLRLDRRSLTVRRETRLNARVSRQRIEVRQETTIRVRHGELPTLDVVVPAGLASRWEVSDGKQPIRTEDLEDVRPDVRRSRLTFERPILETTLVFHFRLPIGRGVDPAKPTSLRIPWIAPEIGPPGSCVVELTSDPDVRVDVEDPLWTSIDEEPVDARRVQRFRLDRDDLTDGLAVTARQAEAVPMPAVVASRALIRSTQDTNGDLRVRAWYALESHPAFLTVALPENARWLRIRVDGRSVDQLEGGADERTGRLKLPDESAGRAVVVDLEYRMPAASVRRPWLPPALLDGAEVLQTYWLVQLPWSQAMVGQPRGWSDENQWSWDVYAWKRRPVAAPDKLIAWAAGPSAPSAATDDALDVDDAFHGYLFSRAGQPSPLDPWVVSRAWAVLICSTLALASVLGLIALPQAAPWILGGMGAAVVPALIFLPPGAVAFAVQSAAFGIGLGLLAHFALRARRPDPTATVRHSSNPIVVTSESSRRSALNVGSDDSTAIRTRPASTMDYPTPTGRGAPDVPLSSRLNRGTRTD